MSESSISPVSSTPLVFPLDIMAASTTYRPMVVFTQENNNAASSNIRLRSPVPMISLPIPIGIATADKSTYTEKELGIFGNAVAGSLQGGANTDAIQGVYDKAKEQFGGSKEEMTSLVLNGLKSVSPNISSAASIGAGTIFNPYMNTEFSGVDTRSFSFKFTLIPTSKEEADLIRQIVYAFRSGIYPVSSGFQLLYPPSWTIRFVALSGGAEIKELDHIPKIFSCYLDSVDSTFNSSNNMWRNDSAPFATDLSLSFKETRALTYEDIVSLNSNKPKRTGINVFTPDVASPKDNTSLLPGLDTIKSPPPINNNGIGKAGPLGTLPYYNGGNASGTKVGGL